MGTDATRQPGASAGRRGTMETPTPSATRAQRVAMVRASAIQSLAQMKASDPSVIAMMENARQDRDPRVRDEAIVAVKLLTGEDTTTVQPAIHTTEKK